MRYRGFKASLIILTLMIAAACTHHHSQQMSSAQAKTEIPKNKTVLVLLDKTASVNDQKTIFAEALTKILGDLNPGDKFRLSLITGESDSDFDFVVSLNVPKNPDYNPLTTNEAVYKDTVATADQDRKKIIANVRAQTTAILVKKPTAQTTDLFGAIYSSSLFFDKDPNRKILVILSDMIEEDANWRFNHVRWNKHLRATIMKHEKHLGLVPNLKGVCIYVVGAKGNTLDMAQNIRFFWTEYFKETHSDFSPERYAHTMLHWPPESECGSPLTPQGTAS